MNDRSNEALLARRAIVEKATPYGPVLLPPSPCEDSWHVRNDSDTKVIRCYGFANNGTDEAARHLALYIASTPPETVIADIDEILRLRAEVERLEREAEWLANHCREFCKSYSYCGECPMFRGWLSCVYEDCGETVGYRGEQHTANWREAARKAVEKQCQK